MRYGNDIELTELARQIKNEMSSLDTYLTNGYLDGAFLRALTMTKRLDQFMERLNKIKYPPKVLESVAENLVAAERE